jgi:GT2 family glycosyltransferase
MAKVTVIQVIYNSRRFIRPVFESVFNQTFKDFEFVAVIGGNDDGSKEYISQNFPQVKIIDPGYNIGFARGHNLVFEQSDSDFFQLVNPDLILEPDYIEKMLKVFADATVGAATGKLLKYDFENNHPFYSPPCKGGERPARHWLEPRAMAGGGGYIIDSTGVTINKSGRARDRGQHEIDSGQYDNQKIVQAVSAAGAMYRVKTLEAIKLKRFEIRNSKSEKNLKSEILNLKSDFEYFDEDFHSYWEDVDLAWRMSNAGHRCAFVPSAVAYHSRSAASSPGGYKKFKVFVKFHRAVPLRIRQLNYQNHILMYVKNSPWFYPQFFIREFFMFFYILFFEISTLKILPQLISVFPKIWRKRTIINNER